MYTQVAHAEMVDRILSRVAAEYGIKVDQVSLPLMNSYQTGDWFYDADSMLEIRLSRWGTEREEIVRGFPLHTEEREAFEAQLESDLREKIELLRSEPQVDKRQK